MRALALVPAAFALLLALAPVASAVSTACMTSDGTQMCVHVNEDGPVYQSTVQCGPQPCVNGCMYFRCPP